MLYLILNPKHQIMNLFHQINLFYLLIIKLIYLNLLIINYIYSLYLYILLHFILIPIIHYLIFKYLLSYHDFHLIIIQDLLLHYLNHLLNCYFKFTINLIYQVFIDVQLIIIHIQVLFFFPLRKLVINYPIFHSMLQVHHL